MIVAAKAFFRVTAGVVPGESRPEYEKRWDYSSADYEQDRVAAPDEETVFAKQLKLAHDYAMSITNPAYLNWVRTEFLWV
jgi:hypothetical protein